MEKQIKLIVTTIMNPATCAKWNFKIMVIKYIKDRRKQQINFVRTQRVYQSLRKSIKSLYLWSCWFENGMKFLMNFTLNSAWIKTKKWNRSPFHLSSLLDWTTKLVYIGAMLLLVQWAGLNRKSGDCLLQNNLQLYSHGIFLRKRELQALAAWGRNWDPVSQSLIKQSNY